MPVNDSFKVVNHVTGPLGKSMSWSWGFNQTIGAAPVSAKQCADGWAFLCGPFITAFYPNVFYNAGYTVMKAGATIAEVYEIKYGLTKPGTRVPTSPAQATFNNSFVISKRTEFATTKYRGRSFIPGVMDEDYDNTQLVEATAFAALGTLASNIFVVMDNTNTSGNIPVSTALRAALIHPNAAAPHAFTSNILTAAIPMRYCGSQRRRRVMIFT